jgi:hypothetical protein
MAEKVADFLLKRMSHWGVRRAMEFEQTFPGARRKDPK